MLAVLRGELAATSFGGEVYLAALFFACLAAHPRDFRRSPYQAYGFGLKSLRLHLPSRQKKRTRVWSCFLDALPGYASLAGGWFGAAENCVVGRGWPYCSGASRHRRSGAEGGATLAGCVGVSLYALPGYASLAGGWFGLRRLA